MPTALAEPLVGAKPAPAAASAPLRLDALVIRQAYRDSKGTVRQLGDASGTYTGTSPVSKEEQLAHDVAKTGKPDCVGKDSGSAGLLSPIVMAYLAVRGQCK